MMLISPVETKSFASHFGITLSTTHPVKKCLASWKLRTTCTYVAVLLLQFHNPASYILVAYIWCENFETLGPTLSNLKNFSIPSFSFGNRVIKFSMIFSLLDTNGNLLTFPFIGSPIATFKNTINLYKTQRYMLSMIDLWKNTNKPYCIFYSNAQWKK